MFEKKRWGDISELKYGKALSGYRETSGEEVPVYGTNGEIGFTTEPQVDRAGVIIGRKGAYRGVHYSARPFWVIDTAFYLVTAEGIYDRWAYYSLQLSDINGLDSGSAIPSTTRDAFASMPVLVPEYLEQVGIAEVLGALDDKIAANIDVVRIAMALMAALYDQKIEHAPSRLVPVADLVRRLVQTRKLSKVDVIREGVVPIFDQSDEGLLGFASGEGYFHASPSEPVLYFGDHTCKLRVATQGFFVGPNTIPFVGDGVDTAMLFFALQGVQKQEEYKRHWQELMNKRVPLPEPANHVELTDVSTGLFSLRTTLEVESRQLVALRDTLLPELMSGRLRVKDAEKKIEEVV